MAGHWWGCVNLTPVISMALQVGQAGESADTGCRRAAAGIGEARLWRAGKHVRDPLTD